MYRLLIVLLLVPAVALSAPVGSFEKDNVNKIFIQDPAPNGTLAQLITVDSVTIDASTSLWWELYAPTACKVRTMPTADKGSYPQLTVVQGERLSRYVNKSTPFINLSGCSDGEFQRQ